MKLIGFLLLAITVVSVQCRKPKSTAHSASQKCQVPQPTITTDVTRDRAIILSNECKAETGATDADIEGLLKHELSTTRREKCLRSCVMRKLSFIDSNGRLNESIVPYIQAMAMGNIEMIKMASGIFSICDGIKVDKDDCEAAEQYSACLKREVESRNFSLALTQ